MGDWAMRLKLLKETHQHLNKVIDGRTKTGAYDDKDITEMKKQRLRLKEQIEALEKEHANET